MPKRILVLGAGYGGVVVSQLLGDQATECDLAVTLVDAKDYQLLIPFLHRASGGNLAPTAPQVPLSRLIRDRPVNFLRAAVQHIDPAHRSVQTSAGELAYDRLVIALGSETQFFDIEGLPEHALTLKSVADVWQIRQHVCSVLHRAAESQGAERQALAHILVCGGGYTGVQIACELADSRRDLAHATGVSPDEIRITVAEALPGILRGFPAKLARVAAETMRDKGILLRLNQPVVKVDAGGVVLKDDGRVDAGTNIWVAGVKAASTLTCSGLRTGSGKRVVVNPFLQCVEHPEVYVIGDCALALDPATGRPVAGSAQMAVQEAQVAAYNILGEGRGRNRPFVPHEAGFLVALGRHNAVGYAFGVNVRGRIAYALKMAAEMRYLNSVGGPSLAASVFSWPRRPIRCEGKDEQAA